MEQNLETHIAACLSNAEAIFVREGGETEALSEIPPERQAHWIATWWNQRKLRVIIKEVRKANDELAGVVGILEYLPVECVGKKVQISIETLEP